VIRFTAVLSVVVVAIGLLVAGALSGNLALVYVAIGLAALALAALAAGVIIWRDEIFDRVPAVSGSQAAAGEPAFAQAGISPAGKQALAAGETAAGEPAGGLSCFFF